MGKQIVAPKTINRIQERALNLLLVDTCKIYPPDRRRTPSGSYQEYAGPLIEYRGSTDIPCRLDVARFFRSSTIEDQAITVNDYELHLPYDAYVKADHRIVIRDEVYEVRKMMGEATNTITKILLITRLDNIKNPIKPAP